MNQEKVKNSVIKINCALELERRIVGMKFLFTKKEFEEAEAPQLTSKLSYCRMVGKVTSGEKLKADFTNFGCFGGARALGIIEKNELYTSGRSFKNCGLYQDLATAKEVANNITCCNHKAFGVLVMPLEEFTSPPDVVTIITNPRNAMRIIQGYTHYFGTHNSYKMIGLQAICSESTAHPYETNDISMSMLCNGPRSSGMKDYEMAIGLPFNRFTRVVDGICKTITPVEHNDSKLKIKERFEKQGIKDVEIILNRNYWSHMGPRNKEYFNEYKPSFSEEELPLDIWRPIE